MLDVEGLLRRFKIWNQHLEKVCNEIGANELAFRPMPESNSTAWILMHMISSYREFIELTGPQRAEELLGGLPHSTDAELVEMRFPQIFSIVEAHREAFLREVKRLLESNRLAHFCPAGEGKTWMDLVQTLIDHEIYHCGQLAYIARVLQQRAQASRER